ncbi:MAG: hypothetical protein HN377_11540 [Alphaproteobacteria bacterium]|jgi:hypothetical protein|nr:hypothetical protein [Alphaproteobacteria bacterium]MBT7943006.1 hypothetical protein [Alphaproteobacteria bacterium]
MIASPEFRRNLWLEFSPYRLAAMPVILGAIFLITTLGGRRALDEITGSVSAFLFVVLVILWGTRLAGETVTGEVLGRTWDQQRLSAIGAWPLAWGKLFGAPAYAWYGGAICMVIYTVSQANYWPPGTILSAIGLYIATGLLAHATALVLSLQAVQRRRAFGRVQGLWYQVAAVVPAGVILYSGVGGLEGNGNYAMTTWFGITLAKTHFMLATAVVFVGWALLGVHALMRLELMFRHGPWRWLGFVIFAMAFFGGMDFSGWSIPTILTALPRGPSVAFIIAAVAAYAVAFGEPKHRVRFRRLAHYTRAGQWRRVFELAPRSALTLLLAAGAALIAAVNVDTGVDSGQIRLPIVAVFLFLVRDIGFIFVLNLKKDTGAGSADARAFLFLVLAYALGPALAETLGASPLSAIFWPQWEAGALTTIAPPLIEVCIIAYLLAGRLRKVS